MSQNLKNFAKFQKLQLDNLIDFEKLLENACLLAKIGAYTAENERNYPTGPLPSYMYPTPAPETDR